MTLEHDHDRDRHQAADDARPRDAAVPGRASRSAALNAPTNPLISGLLMRKDSGGSIGGEASEDVDRALSSGGGRGLPDDLRGRFEDSLGTDLSGVRIHEGAESEAAASSVAAKAFTVGNDIHFGAGQYDPGSPQGQHLIAHEVAHTVQQRGGSRMRQNKLRVSQANDSFEVAADRAADAMVAGAPASLGGASIGLARLGNDDQEHNDSDGAAQNKSDKINTARNSVAGKDGNRTFRSGETGLTIAGKKTSLKFGPDGLTGGLTLVKEDWPLGKKLDKSVAVPVTPGTGVFFRVGGGVEGGIDADIKAAGTKPTGDTLTGTITGSASASLTAKGRVTAGGYVGAPIANLNVGGYLELSASASFNVSVAGSITIMNDTTSSAKPKGKVTVTATPQLQVVGSGGITVGYCAVVTEGTLYEHQMGSLPIADVSYPVVYTYDFETGQGTWGKKGWDVKFLPLQLGSATARPLGDAGKFIEKRVKKIKEQKAQADANAKDHRLDHGIDDENQQTVNIPPGQEPEDCTHPNDLLTGHEKEPEKPRPKTWVSTVE
jgi:hypothetical protein